jgi:hypothetical protein
MSKKKQGWIIKNLRIVALRKGEVWMMESHNKPLKRAKPQSAKAQAEARKRADYWQNADVKEKERVRKRNERAHLVAAGKTVHGTKRKRPYVSHKGRK